MLQSWVRMRFKGTQNNVFSGKQCLDFLAKSHKACLSTYFRSRPLNVATSVHTTILHSVPGLTWDAGTRGKGRAGARAPGERAASQMCPDAPGNPPALSICSRGHGALEHLSLGPRCLELKKPAETPTHPLRAGEKGLFVPTAHPLVGLLQVGC